MIMPQTCTRASESGGSSDVLALAGLEDAAIMKHSLSVGARRDVQLAPSMA